MFFACHDLLRRRSLGEFGKDGLAIFACSMLDKGDDFAIRSLVDHVAKGTVFLDSAVAKEILKAPKGIFGDVVRGSDGLVGDTSHRCKVFFVYIFASGCGLKSEFDELREFLRGFVEPREAFDYAMVAPLRKRLGTFYI